MHKIKLAQKKKLRGSVIKYVDSTLKTITTRHEKDRIIFDMYNNVLSWLGTKTNSRRNELILHPNKAIETFCKEMV